MEKLKMAALSFASMIAMRFQEKEAIFIWKRGLLSGGNLQVVDFKLKEASL